ncbi:MAG: nucleoside deaminase [Bacteroidia bacterium]|nr:nucleoside deaminase [Bacteroidia bacterium]
MPPDHTCWLDHCDRLALQAIALGNPPVGSVIIRAGQLIAEGIEAGKTHQDITYHAEIEAIRAAVRILGHTALADCQLYTSHEPCIMCAYVIRHHRIREVIIRHRVPHIGGVTSAYPILTATDIPIWGTPPGIVFEKT